MDRDGPVQAVKMRAMMSADTYMLYLAAIAIFFASPPDTSQLLIISNSVRHGLRRSGLTIMGDLCANVLQMSAAAFGLAAVIATSAEAFFWLKWVRSIGGSLDGLWLNAAFATIELLEEVTAPGFDRMMAVNVRGPMLQLAALSPFLNPGASIVVTASSSVYEGAALTSLYGATKSADLAMVRSWARQLAERGIRVNTLVPGPINTNFRRFLPEETRRAFEGAVVDLVPLKRMGTADEAAAVALFLLSDDASFVSGSQYAVDGGMMMR